MAIDQVRWGILGPGGIARSFLRGAAGSTTGTVTALGSRNPDRAELAEHFPGIQVYHGYEALLAEPTVDAIYIATPHPFHAQWAIAAARAGKHVLCEKPAGMNAAEVEAMFAAARANGTFLGEAFMYRLHPLTLRILELLRAGKLGEVRLIKASFGIVSGHGPDQRQFSRELGGGGILDVGGYPLSMVRLIAGYRDPLGHAEPERMTGALHIGPTGVDELATATLAFPGGIMAQIACSITLRQDNVLHIQGTSGRLEVDSFWFGTGKEGGSNTMRFVTPDGQAEPITVTEPRNLYSFQFEAANTAIRRGETRFSHPAMTEADSLGNARALDRWLAVEELALLT